MNKQHSEGIAVTDMLSTSPASGAFLAVVLLPLAQNARRCCASFAAPPPLFPRPTRALRLVSISALPGEHRFGVVGGVDFQSDGAKYGRGEMHLSADLREGDVVVYQTGSWKVDGVTVGDDSKPPTFRYARIETIQIVWTHNCEHGVLRGMPLKLQNEKSEEVGDKQALVADVGAEDMIEFGPEQLVARIPVNWESDDAMRGYPLAPLSNHLWEKSSE